jgi:hypothetical protein
VCVAERDYNPVEATHFFFTKENLSMKQTESERDECKSLESRRKPVFACGSHFFFRLFRELKHIRENRAFDI